MLAHDAAKRGHHSVCAQCCIAAVCGGGNQVKMEILVVIATKQNFPEIVEELAA
jgi:hypothetical protein